MGGLGPGVGGFELVVIGLVALLVVGPKDLPILMRRVGQMVAKARAMANEFRTSFDEMARQSELDDLRKEVEALRTGQAAMYPLGAEADAAFKDINAGLTAPAASTASPSSAPEVAAATPAVDEWPDTGAAPTVGPAAPATRPTRAKAKAKPVGSAKVKAAGAAQTKAVPSKTPKTPKTPKTTPAGAATPKVARKKAADL